MGDKATAALVAAFVAAPISICSNILTEVIKRHLVFMDGVEALTDEVTSELLSLGRLVSLGHKPDVDDVRSISEKRTRLGNELGRAFSKSGRYGAILTAFEVVDRAIELIETEALRDGDAGVVDHDFKAASDALAQAVRERAFESKRWRWLRGR